MKTKIRMAGDDLRALVSSEVVSLNGPLPLGFALEACWAIIAAYLRKTKIPMAGDDLRVLRGSCGGPSGSLKSLLGLCGGALGIPLRRLGVLLGSLGPPWCAKWLNDCKTNGKT